MNNDLISREALKKAICIDEPISIDETWEQLYDAVIKAIDNAPSIEYTFEEAFQKTVCENKLYCPAKPQGEWTIGYTAKQKKVAVCNLCNCISFQGKTNFCHNCGAKMKGGQNDRNQTR